MSIGNKARRPQLPGTVFEMRGSKTRWPTLRGAYLNDQSVDRLKPLSTGVVFLDGSYNTRLNFRTERPPKERAIFFEHGYTLRANEHGKNMKAYLLTWIGNYYNGSVIHIAPQYPQFLYFEPEQVEKACFHLYWRVAKRIYKSEEDMDSEVREFIAQTC